MKPLHWLNNCPPDKLGDVVVAIGCSIIGGVLLYLMLSGQV
jgi:hypothetical protein